MSEYIVEVNDRPTIKQEGWNVRCDDLFIQHEEIVRCKDCKHRVHYWHHDCERWQCAHEMLEGLDVSPGFFCAWGERKGDAE